MTKVTLDSIRADADAKYGPFIIEVGDQTYTLVNLLRLDKDTRKEVFTLLQSLSNRDETDMDLDEVEVTLDKVFVALGAAGLLEENLDLAVKLAILRQWQGETQAGEATPSPS